MDTITTTNIPVGEKVLVTRYYGRDIDFPEICTVIGDQADSDGDLCVNSGGLTRYAYRGCYTRIPKVGEKVIAVKVPGMAEYEGKVGTVADPERQSWGERALQAGKIDRDGRPRLYVTFGDSTSPLWATEWRETEPSTDSVEEPVEKPLVKAAREAVSSMSEATVNVLSRVETAEQLAVEFARLAGSVDEAASRDRRLREEIAALRSDIKIIGETVRDQAVERDWCEEYETIRGQVARKMSVHGSYVWEESSSREQDYEISIEVPITARATKMITITAASEEEALEKAKEEAADYVDSDDIDHYSIDWDWDNAEVESV